MEALLHLLDTRGLPFQVIFDQRKERNGYAFWDWITGRKRVQGGQRAQLPLFEKDETTRIKINPLAAWTPKMIADYMDAHDLPRHPLVSRGFASIGCAPCTTKVAKGEDARAGRWRGQEKSECGIHFVDGKAVRRETAA